MCAFVRERLEEERRKKKGKEREGERGGRRKRGGRARYDSEVYRYTTYMSPLIGGPANIVPQQSAKIPSSKLCHNGLVVVTIFFT